MQDEQNKQLQRELQSLYKDGMGMTVKSKGDFQVLEKDVDNHLKATDKDNSNTKAQNSSTTQSKSEAAVDWSYLAKNKS